MDIQAYKNTLLRGTQSFVALEKELWAYQVQENPVMREFCGYLDLSHPVPIPIAFFKDFDLQTGGPWEAEQVFHSSGTTGQVPSRHLVRDLQWYRQVVLAGFSYFFPAGDYRILALLPSYLERGNSSLVYMVKTWMDHFGLPGSGFYLDNFDALEQAIVEGQDAQEDILLIGVSFALLDFAEKASLALGPKTRVIETGGMKGRRAELLRSELHIRLKEGLGASHIHSEYGMTELMSQAYALESGRFQCPPWMHINIVDINLPFRTLLPGHTGRIAITDLANVHSCAFILTDDLGIKQEDGSFEVLGRIEGAEIRGCNLMYE